jgi:hypothetical protein
LRANILPASSGDHACEVTVNARELADVLAMLGKSVDYSSFNETIASSPAQRDKLSFYDDFLTGMRRYQETAALPHTDRHRAAEAIDSGEIAKRGGGYLARVLETLNGFKDKYGHWPTTIHLSPTALEALRSHHLTPCGFQTLQSKLDLIVGENEVLMAEDKAGLAFEYAKEGWSGKRPPKGADEWLWEIKL